MSDQPTAQLTAEHVEIGSLKTFKGNPRRGDVEAIRASLRANGQYRPIVVRTKTREVLAGNHTLLAAKAEGWERIWVTFIDCDAAAAKRIVLADNRTAELGDYDDGELIALLGSLPELDGTGWTQKDLDKLTGEIGAGFGAPIEIPPSFDVLISCASEQEQVALLERLSAEGLQCRALIS